MTTFVKIEISRNGDGAVQFRTNKRVVLADEIASTEELKSAIRLALGSIVPDTFYGDELFIDGVLVDGETVDLTGFKKIGYKINTAGPKSGESEKQPAAFSIPTSQIRQHFPRTVAAFRASAGKREQFTGRFSAKNKKDN